MGRIALGVALALCLLIGFAVGWTAGKRSRATMPNAFVAMLVLIAGSLGGPLLTYVVLGRGAISYMAATLLSGWAAGFVFWPMGQPQQVRQWF